MIKDSAQRGVFGIHEWSQREGQMRASQPVPDPDQLADYLARAEHALKLVSVRDSRWSALLGLLGHLDNLLTGVPDDAGVQQLLDELAKPIPDTLSAHQADISAQRRRMTRAALRWQRELTAGQDEEFLPITEADRSLLAGVGGEHLIRVPLAAAADGRRPFADADDAALDRAIADCMASLRESWRLPPAESRAKLEEAALLVAERFYRDSVGFGARHTRHGRIILDPDDLYGHVGKWGEITWSAPHELRHAAVAVATDEMVRWFAHIRANPTQTGLSAHGMWIKEEVRTIVNHTSDRLRSARDQGRQRANSAGRSAASSTTGLLRQLTALDQVTRVGALLVLENGTHTGNEADVQHGGPFNVAAPAGVLPNYPSSPRIRTGTFWTMPTTPGRWADGFDLSGRRGMQGSHRPPEVGNDSGGEFPVRRSMPRLDQLEVTQPMPWLRGWWAHHVAHHPEQALDCFTNARLIEKLGTGATSIVQSVGGVWDLDALLVEWTSALVELVKDRRKLSARVVALQRNADLPCLLGPLARPVASRRSPPPRFSKFSPPDPDDIEELFVVPHVVAEGIVFARGGDDLGPAARISPALQNAYLDTDPGTGVWPATRLERARRTLRR